MSVKSLTYRPEATVQEIAQLVTDLTAAWNAREIDRAVTFYAPEYEGVDVAQAAPQRGPDGIRQTMSRYLQAFPDLQFLLEDTLVQGDQAALFWTAQGTHQGVLMNIPPTGRRIQARGVSLLTLADGKVVRALYVWDVAGLLRGIGLLPEL